MKIIRHTARDMRQALRGVREQLGEDAVILSSRRTPEGIEVTAAVDFDASTIEAEGFANSTQAAPAAARAVKLVEPAQQATFRAAPAVAAPRVYETQDEPEFISAALREAAAELNTVPPARVADSRSSASVSSPANAR